MTSEEVFARAFVEAALFTDTPEGYDGDGIVPRDEERMREFACAFYRANEADVLAYPEGVVQAGHDLWFTGAGHGVGYWENDDVVSRRLDVAVDRHAFGGLYEGDDGLLYWEYFG